MIKLQVIDNRTQHGIFFTTEPARFEFVVVQGRLVVDAYHGADIDMKQEPAGCYDGNIDSVSWEEA